MAQRRVFLGWTQPALPAAADYLRTRYVQGDAWDLSRVTVVVPGRRAGRRLLELLVFAAKDQGLLFTPPDITTEGALPERLYQPKKPFAEKLVQDLAWSAALRQLPKERLVALIPHPPSRNDEQAWLRLGGILRTQHAELAAETLDFADVVRRGSELEGFPDRERWEAMHAAQEIYLRTLDALELWDRQTARLFALKFREFQTDRDIVLLGTVDLSRTIRAMLDQVSEHVTTLIAAPAELAERFDGHGCVVPSAWSNVEIVLREEQIRRVEGPAEQADAVARILASYGGAFRGDQITLGVPDEKLVPQLGRQMEQIGVPARWVEGKKLDETGPALLLGAIAEFLDDQSTASFAALIRHPDVYDRLVRAGAEIPIVPALLGEVDRLQSEHLLKRIDPEQWPAVVRDWVTKDEDFQHVRPAYDRLQTLLAPLVGPMQSISAWSTPILACLANVYSTVPETSEGEKRAFFATLESIRDILQLQATLPVSLAPQLRAAEAIRWTLSQLAGVTIPPPADEEAVELLGWLELPLDDAPALIVTTFNEGFVPDSHSSDAFLPNRLRAHLGLLDNDRRYARDAYSLSLLLASRQSVHLLSARRDAQENPLMPSRFLFAAAPEKIVARSLQFFSGREKSPPRTPLVGFGIPLPPSSRLYVPSPEGKPLSPESLRVTQFRDYLACPYRFYLRHILKLEACELGDEELSGSAFGNLVHSVLQAFGKETAIRDCERPDDIFAYLDDQLLRRTAVHYGSRGRPAAVEIQMEQIRLRLAKFAAWQARRTSEGWRIHYTEDTDAESRGEPEVMFDVDGEPIRIHGRIDRIDRHETGNRYAILDYKTADAGDKPERTHRRGDEWIDLQLPLYRLLAKAWGMSGQMELGYILLPKSLEEVGEAMADWSESELQSAEETAREVVRGIRRGEYWPPSDAPAYEDAYSAICQDRRLGGRVFDHEDSTEKMP